MKMVILQWQATDKTHQLCQIHAPQYVTIDVWGNYTESKENKTSACKNGCTKTIVRTMEPVEGILN